MREHWYQHGTDGSWVAAIAADTLLAVDPDAGVGVSEVWAALPSGFQGVLDILTSKGIAATPSFALLSWEPSGELRVIVRGPVKLTVTSDGNELLLDGTGVSTWTEMRFAPGAEFVLNLGEVPNGPLLPLVSGAVVATGIRSSSWATEASAAEASAAEASSRVAEASTPARETATDAAAPAEDAPTLSLPEATVQDLWDESVGATVHREPDPEPEPALAVAAPAPEGDHDGMTIMAGDIRRMRAERRAAASASSSALGQEASALWLELSNGTVETLDQTLIVGRSPSASKVSGGAIPRLVTIPGDKDISRNHAQFAVEGGTVVVTDLHSRNGTQVILPGRAPQQLRQGEPTTVIPGTVIDLGGGVTLTVCEGE